MSANNNCTFMGNIVRDSELKSTQGGTSFVKNAIAVNTGYGDNKKTHFLNFTIWGNRAESFAKFVKKGNRVLLQCEAQQNEYTNKDGVKVSTIDFRANDWEFAQSRSEANDDGTPSNAQTPVGATNPAAAPVGDNSFLDIPDGTDAELPFS